MSAEAAPPDSVEQAEPPARPPRPRTGGIGGFVTSFRAVFDRDFLFLTSRPRFVLMRTILALLLVALTATVFLQPNDPSQRGQVVMFSLTTATAFLLAFLGPAMAASTIAGERSLGTLDLILASPIGAFRFVLAKLVSRWAIMLVIVLIVVPLLGLALMYGGVDGVTLLDGLLLLCAIGLWSVAGGVLVSAFSKRVATAALGGLLFSLLVPILHVMALVAFSSFFFGGMRGAISDSFWASLTPGGAWFVYATSYIPGARAGFSIGVLAMRSAAVFALLVVIASSWRVAREAGFASRSGTKKRHARTFPFANPTVSRGLWTTLFFKPRVGGVLFAMLIAGLHVGALALGVSNDWNDRWYGELDEEWPHLLGLLFATPIVSLAALSWAAPTIAHERQTGALDMISVSRLSDPEILLGHLCGVLARAGLALAVPAGLAFLAALTPGCELNLLNWLVWLVTSAIQVLLFTAIGLAFSCHCATSKRAVVTSFGVVIGLIVVHLLAGAVLGIAIGDAVEEGLFFWFCANPVLSVHLPTVLSTENSFNDGETVAMVAAVLWNGIHLAIATGLLAFLPKILRKSREST